MGFKVIHIGIRAGRYVPLGCLIMLFSSMRHVCENTIDSCFIFHLQDGNETSAKEASASLGCSKCRELGQHVVASESEVLASSTVFRML